MTHYLRNYSLLCLTLLAALSASAQGLHPPSSSIQNLNLSSVAARAVQGGAQQADYIVAVVNSEPITRSELQLRVVRARAQLTQQGIAVPPQEELARQVLERLIGEKAQLQMATENGVRVEEDMIDQAEQNVARQNQIDVAELRRRVQADGLSLTRFRAELRDQIALSRLREREVDARVKVSDQEIDQYLRDQTNNTDLSGMEVELAQVLVEVPEKATPEQTQTLKARAQKVLERARAGEDFSALIREFSDGMERASGKSMGLRSADRYPILFIQAIQGLDKGAIAGPLRSSAGFHVLKLIDRRSAGLPPSTTTQNHARHILLRTGPQLTQPAAVARLADVKKRIQAGQTDFATQAKGLSQDGSAKDGGDLGWAAPGQFVPEFEDVLMSLAPGQISDPVVSRFGVHLIQLIERRETPLSVREQRELVRNFVREKKLDEAYVAWIQDVRGKAYVEFREPPL
jgi:peptidyl-prolyl cis-trans isomerase SurA